jgi:hypothetical protein
MYNLATWGYLDCETGNWVVYAHGLTHNSGQSPSFDAWIFNPFLSRFYLVRHFAGKAKSSYIDFVTGNVIEWDSNYTRPPTPHYASGAAGGVFIPTTGQMYTGNGMVITDSYGASVDRYITPY